MPASTQHPDYTANLQRWELVRDCVEGEDHIKQRSNGAGDSSTQLMNAAGTRYLPAPNPDDTSSENLQRYIAYRTRASFVNFTGFTKEGLNGMVFRKPMTIELPQGLEYLLDNADGGGTGLEQLTKDGIADSMETGRYGLLADYPQATAGLTQAQVLALGLTATICAYPAESVVNWRWEVSGAFKRLSMVVLAEPVKVYVDEFEFEVKIFHRVLSLVDGVYTQLLYNEDDELVMQGEEPFIQPRNASGQTWDHIPFQFIGSQNNDPSPDRSILLDLAAVNISHYRNSADYEESSFMVGQPTPAISGLTQGWVDEVMKGGVMLGSRSAMLLPEGGSATLLQADSNQMPEKGMERKEEQMVMIGARIIQDSGGVETAEAAKIRFAGQNSKLSVLVGNWEQGLENVLSWISEFMGVAGDSEVDINKQYYDKTISAQEIVADIQLLDRQVIAVKDLRDGLRKSGRIAHDRSDEDIESENGTASPL